MFSLYLFTFSSVLVSIKFNDTAIFQENDRINNDNGVCMAVKILAGPFALILMIIEESMDMERRL